MNVSLNRGRLVAEKLGGWISAAVVLLIIESLLFIALSKLNFSDLHINQKFAGALTTMPIFLLGLSFFLAGIWGIYTGYYYVPVWWQHSFKQKPSWAGNVGGIISLAMGLALMLGAGYGFWVFMFV